MPLVVPVLYFFVINFSTFILHCERIQQSCIKLLEIVLAVAELLVPEVMKKTLPTLSYIIV